MEVMSKMMSFKIALVFIQLLIVISIANSQETQVNFCPNVQMITPSIAKNINYFYGINNFKEASLYQSTDSSYIIEIYYSLNNKTVRERRVISKEKLTDICSQINITEPSSDFDVEDLGKNAQRRLLASSLTYSLCYYGYSIPLAFDMENSKGYMVSYMFVGSAAFFIPLVGTKDKMVTWGMSKGFSLGNGLGITHGVELSALLFGDDMSSSFTFGLSTITGLSEGLIAYKTAKKYGCSSSQMGIIGYGGIWGTLYGAATPYLLKSENERTYGFGSIIGSGLGMIGGNYIYSKYKLSNGDLTITNATGVLGALVPLAIMNSITEDHPRGMVLSMMAGSLVGLGLGVNKTKSCDYTNQQGNIVTLGTFAGYLTGAGFGYLLESEPKGYLILTTLGAVSGFLITDKIVKKDFGTNNKSGLSFNIDVNPYSIYGLLGNNEKSTNFHNQNIESNYIVKLQMKF